MHRIDWAAQIVSAAANEGVGAASFAIVFTLLKKWNRLIKQARSIAALSACLVICVAISFVEHGIQTATEMLYGLSEPAYLNMLIVIDTCTAVVGMLTAVVWVRQFPELVDFIAILEAVFEHSQGLILLNPIVTEAANSDALRVQQTIEQDLQSAIDEGQFKLYFQPIVDLQKTGSPIVGFEALVRWEHPTRGLLMPNDFIPAAEKSGLVHLISRWVLIEACHYAEQWSAPEAYKIAINLSSHDLSDLDFVAEVHRILEQNTGRTNKISFELTESSADGRSLEQMATALDGFRNRGVEVGLDDFGTGFNTLSFLSLPIDLIKIDKQFVSGIHASPTLCGFLKAIATDRGLKVVAEGVETREQAQMLYDYGIDYAQGYFYGKPEPPEIVVSLIRKNNRSIF